MKTKIIYISGGEVFPPHAVRAAFETVREMLGLDADTVIFGVPVDRDDIGAGAEVAPSISAIANEEKIEPEVTERPLDAAAPPVEKKKERKKKKEEAKQIDAGEPSPAPILSIIGALQPTPEAKPELVEVEVEAEQSAEEAEPEPEEESIEAEVEAEQPAEEVEVEGEAAQPMEETEPVAVEPRLPTSDFRIPTSESRIPNPDDMLAEAADESVQSIEDIFKGIPPLAEDRPVDLTAPPQAEEVAPEEDDADSTAPAADLSPVAAHDEDTTLSKLAAEFVAAHPASDSVRKGADDDVGAGKSKIGRLKNILPFKKKEKTESSVFGDLFGWAGVAANDDADGFAMPDFFQAGSNR